MSSTRLRRAATAVAAAVLLAIILGCMSLNFGGGSSEIVREEVAASEIVPVGYGPGDAVFEHAGGFEQHRQEQAVGDLVGGELFLAAAMRSHCRSIGQSGSLADRSRSSMFMPTAPASISASTVATTSDGAGP